MGKWSERAQDGGFEWWNVTAQLSTARELGQKQCFNALMAFTLARLPGSLKQGATNNPFLTSV